MATVTGFTSERMLEIEQTTVVDGEVQGDNLILLTRAGTPIDAGNVRGATGAQGPVGVTHVIQDEGVPAVPRPTLNFVGSGVAVTDDAANTRTLVTVTQPRAGHVVQDEGTSLSQRANLNFVGSGVAVADDAANDRSIVTVPAPGIISEVSTDTYESGEIGLEWLNMWGYGFQAIAGYWYEINWSGTFIGKIANAGRIGASTRMLMTTPSLGASQLTVQDWDLVAPSVAMPFHLWTIWRAPVTEAAEVSIQGAQAWWSATSVRITRTPGMPQRFLIKRLGTMPAAALVSRTAVGLTGEFNRNPNL